MWGLAGAPKPPSDLTFPLTDDASESQDGGYSLTVALKDRAKPLPAPSRVHPTLSQRRSPPVSPPRTHAVRSVTRAQP